MAAPDTRAKAQDEEHGGPLLVIWATLVVVALLLVWWLVYAARGEEPDAGEPEVPAGTARETTERGGGT